MKTPTSKSRIRLRIGIYSTSFLALLIAFFWWGRHQQVSALSRAELILGGVRISSAEALDAIAAADLTIQALDTTLDIKVAESATPSTTEVTVDNQSDYNTLLSMGATVVSEYFDDSDDGFAYGGYVVMAVPSGNLRLVDMTTDEYAQLVAQGAIVVEEVPAENSVILAVPGDPVLTEPVAIDPVTLTNDLETERLTLETEKQNILAIADDAERTAAITDWNSNHDRIEAKLFQIFEQNAEFADDIAGALEDIRVQFKL